VSKKSHNPAGKARADAGNSVIGATTPMLAELHRDEIRV